LCVLLGTRFLVAPPRGLQAEYFPGERAGDRPTLTAIDPSPNTATVGQRWSGAPFERFFVRWFGYLTVPRAGRYTFTVTSDDGSVLSLDGRVVVDHSGAHGPIPKSAAIDLTAGSHAVLLELSQEGGAFAMEWQWARGAGAAAEVPSWALTPYRVPAWRVLLARLLDLASIAALLAALASAAVGMRARGWTPAQYPRTAALALFLGLACAHTWPIPLDPGRLTRHDNRDSILNEWIVSWVAHQAVTDPRHLFDGNIFYPEKRTLAYSEPMLVQAALGAPLLWSGATPTFTYNVLLILGFALTGWSTALVMHRWTGDWIAALVSGCVFGFSAHTLTRIPHLQAQHVEFLPLALLALDTLLRRPSLRRGAVLAVCCVLQGLTSIYLLAITVFAVAAALTVRPAEWLRRAGWPAARALAVTVAVSAVLLAPLLWPYYRVSNELGLSRSLADAAQYAASWTDYLTTPSRLHLATWSSDFRGGTGLFPGLLGLCLAAVTVLSGAAFADPRARMALAIGLVGLYLSFGPHAPGYATLFEVLPLLKAIRGTARFGYMVTLAVAMLAGFGVVIVRRRTPPSTWRPLAVMLVLFAALEPMAAPLGLTRFDGIPPVFDRLPREQGVVAVEVPFPGPRSAQFHAHAMLNSTRHWQPIVNGYSGFQPASFYRHAGPLQLFPDDPALAIIKEIGVTHVFVHTNQYSADQLRQIGLRPDLQRVDSFGETVLYKVR
jgi:hypothetical protein